MTAKTDSVEKLDRTQPPPGYEVSDSEWGSPPGWFWYPDPFEDAQNCGAPLATEAAALAAAWAHYEREHDPPGLQVHAWGYGRREAEQPWWRARDSANLAEARAAAWAWYWRRVEVGDVLMRGPVSISERRATMPVPPRRAWPVCLTWSDAQVAEVERWLAKGGEPPPEVLRA